MKKLSLNKDWRFRRGNEITTQKKGHTETYMSAKAGGASGVGSPDYDISDFERVDIPHDFVVDGEFSAENNLSQGSKARGEAWYKKRFKLSEENRGSQILLEFEGVCTGAVVYCNGNVVKRNYSGYNSFVADITDVAVYGEAINDIALFVDAKTMEGWWYEGAGIYRNVWLYIKEPVHIKQWGVFVHADRQDEEAWETKIEISIENIAYEGLFDRIKRISDETDKTEFDIRILNEIYTADGVLMGSASASAISRAGIDEQISESIIIRNPLVWDIEEPNLYTLVTRLFVNEKECDETTNEFGYRTIAIDKDKGFFLNGRHVELYGTCNHQDHAGVGIAVPTSVNEYRIILLKEMGSNAYRCAHGNPTPDILKYCDKYGILVMDETRNFSSFEEGIEQLKDMVLRDRNHPSVIFYSLFNEEPYQGDPIGRNIASKMKNEVKKLDSTRFFVGAMNTGQLSAKGTANLLDIAGFNYCTHLYDEFREKFPDMPMLGSETDSAFQTRGVYKTDREKHVIDCYDSECAPWGNTYRDGFRQIEKRPHIMGTFIWTGFDYRGEPTPFVYPSISTQFGIMDTCGFKKDAFYLNRALFTKEPMLHLLPHWNHKKGQTVKILAYTNCEEAELFVNNVSRGRKPVDRYDMAEWQEEYEEGTISAVGYIGKNAVCSDSVTTAGEPSKITLELPRDFVYRNSQDAVIVNASVTDKAGVHCPLASNLISFDVRGGIVLGVGNGNPNSHEADRADKRHLFNGWAQAIIALEDNARELLITASSEGLEPCTVSVRLAEPEQKTEYIDTINEDYIMKWRHTVELSSDMPDPFALIGEQDMNTFGIKNIGNGYDEIFNNKTGYCMYKTKAVLSNRKFLEFRSVYGNRVYIYIDTELKFEGECRWGRKVRIPIEGINREVVLTVIIKSEVAEQKGGIDKPVVVY